MGKDDAEKGSTEDDEEAEEASESGAEEPVRRKIKSLYCGVSMTVQPRLAKKSK